MSSTRSNPKIQLLLFMLIGFALGSGLAYLLTNLFTSRDSASIASLQQTIHSLQIKLDAKDAELRNLRQRTSEGGVFDNASNSGVDKTIDQRRNSSEQLTDQSITHNAPNATEILKDLETLSDSDPRSFADKLKEFLSDNPNAGKVAIASRSIFDVARDHERLPDYALQSIYSTQTDPDLKRVIAQVMSQRGNNLLLDSHIAETQAQLKSDQPKDRQEALNQLAKTHSAKAVDVIAPYLLDPDNNVKLDALQALRETGNQKNIGLVEALLNDPDPAISSLASDVLSHLKNLSSSARTTLSKSDIESTLPPLPNP